MFFVSGFRCTYSDMCIRICCAGEGNAESLDACRLHRQIEPQRTPHSRNSLRGLPAARRRRDFGYPGGYLAKNYQKVHDDDDAGGCHGTNPRRYVDMTYRRDSSDGTNLPRFLGGGKHAKARGFFSRRFVMAPRTRDLLRRGTMRSDWTGRATVARPPAGESRRRDFERELESDSHKHR